MGWISQENKFPPGTICAVCNKKRAQDLDHALFPKSPQKRTKKWRDFLDDPMNIQPACADCNRWKRTTDRYESRKKYVDNRMRNTPEEFKKWYYSYPGSLKEGGRYDEIAGMIRAFESARNAA